MIRPTPLTAAAAGVFSALAWPYLWSKYGHAVASGGVEVIIGTLLLVALPAHAFVIGFKGSQASGGRAVDTALLQRIGSWLAASAVTVLVASALRG
jgi:hypothetical protein